MRILAYVLMAALSALPVIVPAIAAAAGKDEEPRPYEVKRDASNDVNAALAAAKLSGKRVIIVMGANWCHDSRALAARFDTPQFQDLIEDNYELVYVDIGQRNSNINIAHRFGIEQIDGTPTVLILSNKGLLLNKDTAPTWRNAASRSIGETLTYFTAYASGEVLAR